VKYRFEGQDYTYDKKLTVAEAMFIFEKSGLGITQIHPALLQGHPGGIAAWMYTLMRRAGKTVKWDDVLKMDIATFELIPDGQELREAQERVAELGKVLAEAEREEAAAKAATPKGGRTRKPATANTSSR
jgi:hypothetical protein